MITKLRLLSMATGGVFAVVIGLAGCEPQKISTADLGKAYADARATLNRCLVDPDPFTRSRAIEALADTIGLHAGPEYEKALSDPAPPVRFAAALAVGDTRYAPAKNYLLRMAEDKTLEPDRRVMPAVIYALYRLGDATYASDLFTLLFDPEKEVRANAALAMGKMQEPSAVGPLKTRLGDEQDPLVRLQIIESLAMLGDAASSLSLEAYTKKTPFIDERLVAIPAMARVHSSNALQVLNELLAATRQPPRVRVSAAGALGMLGQSSPVGLALCREAAADPQKVLDKSYGGRRTGSELEAGSLQRLAALALGWLGNDYTVADLYPLLHNSDGSVRVAAAMSILRLLPAYQQPLPPSALGPSQPAAPSPEQPAGQPAAPSTVPAVAPPVETPPAPPVAAPIEQPPQQPVVQPIPAQPSSQPAVAPSSPPPPTTRQPAGTWKLRTAGGKD
ncbi:MAG: HEAT repeat domain-containing protein [Phycisphaerae bacterium]